MDDWLILVLYNNPYTFMSKKMQQMHFNKCSQIILHYMHMYVPLQIYWLPKRADRDLSVPQRETEREREREWKALNFRDGAIFLFQAKSRRHVREIWHCLSLPARDLWLRPLVKSSQHGVDVVEVYANWLAYLGWTAQVRAVSQAFPALRIGVQENRHDLGCHHDRT